MVAARVAEVILRDERAVFPVGFHNERYDVALSLPSVVGREGVSEVIWPEMSPAEAAALERSAATLEGRGREISGQELKACGRHDEHDGKGRSAGALDGPDIGLALLAVGAGSMDALGFFALGGALPSAMTGNTALLGLALGQGHPAAAAPPFAAGLGFVLGAALAAAMLHLGFEQASGAPWRRLAARRGILSCSPAFSWPGNSPTVRPRGLPLYALILLGAAGMGVQSVAARQDNRPGVTTVVFTSTLTSIVIAVTGAILGTTHRLGFAAKRQMFMFLAYGIGAVRAACLTLHAIGAIPFLPLAAALLALGCIW